MSKSPFTPTFGVERPSRLAPDRQLVRPGSHSFGGQWVTIPDALPPPPPPQPEQAPPPSGSGGPPGTGGEDYDVESDPSMQLLRQAEEWALEDVNRMLKGEGDSSALADPDKTGADILHRQRGKMAAEAAGSSGQFTSPEEMPENVRAAWERAVDQYMEDAFAAQMRAMQSAVESAHRGGG